MIKTVIDGGMGLLALVIPYSGKGRFDTIFSLAIISIDKCPLWGLLAGGRPNLKLLALVLSYSAFSLGVIPKINAYIFSPFGGCWQGEQLLVLVIPYSGNP